MTTLVLKLSEGEARQVARAADLLGLSHEDLAHEAVLLLCRSILPQQRGRPLKARSTRAAVAWRLSWNATRARG